MSELIKQDLNWFQKNRKEQSDFSDDVIDNNTFNIDDDEF